MGASWPARIIGVVEFLILGVVLFFALLALAPDGLLKTLLAGAWLLGLLAMLIPLVRWLAA